MSYIVYRAEKRIQDSGARINSYLVSRESYLVKKKRKSQYLGVRSRGVLPIRPHKVEARYCCVLLANTARRVATKY